MAEFTLDKVVHNLTNRRFRHTAKESVYQLGSAVNNSFYDPRNIGNYDNGEVNPSGTYATHYPVNAGSNTMGFSIMDDDGDDKRSFYPNLVAGNVNALEIKKGGALGGASSGSSSDYLFFNPYYEALLNPASHKVMEDVAQPHYLPVSYENQVIGRGTNAPSSASAVDFAMNNPYAFKSNFNGGALGSASSGSSSDYYDSNPFRVPDMQSEGRHFTEFMSGGAIDWAKYLGYVRKGASKVADVVEKAPAIIEKGQKTLETVQKLRELLKGKEKPKEKASKASRVPVPVKKGGGKKKQSKYYV